MYQTDTTGVTERHSSSGLRTLYCDPARAAIWPRLLARISLIRSFMSFLTSVLFDSTSTLNNLLHRIRRSSSALMLHDPLFITNR
jgi:hypothetical protein